MCTLYIVRIPSFKVILQPIQINKRKLEYGVFKKKKTQFPNQTQYNLGWIKLHSHLFPRFGNITLHNRKTNLGIQTIHMGNRAEGPDRLPTLLFCVRLTDYITETLSSFPKQMSLQGVAVCLRMRICLHSTNITLVELLVFPKRQDDDASTSPNNTENSCAHRQVFGFSSLTNNKICHSSSLPS